MTSSKTSEKPSIWDRQEQFGTRMADVFDEREKFVLHAFEPVGDIELTGGRKARKTELVVSKLGQSETRTISTLSSPIADMAAEAVLYSNSDDLPAVVFWQHVPTKQGQPAVVLQLVERYNG